MHATPRFYISILLLFSLLAPMATAENFERDRYQDTFTIPFHVVRGGGLFSDDTFDQYEIKCDIQGDRTTTDNDPYRENEENGNVDYIRSTTKGDENWRAKLNIFCSMPGDDVTQTDGNAAHNLLGYNVENAEGQTPPYGEALVPPCVIRDASISTPLDSGSFEWYRATMMLEGRNNEVTQKGSASGFILLPDHCSSTFVFLFTINGQTVVYHYTVTLWNDDATPDSDGPEPFNGTMWVYRFIFIAAMVWSAYTRIVNWWLLGVGFLGLVSTYFEWDPAAFVTGTPTAFSLDPGSSLLILAIGLTITASAGWYNTRSNRVNAKNRGRK